MLNKTIFNGATNIPVTAGDEYIIEGYVRLIADPINLPQLIRLLFKPVTYSLSDLDTFTQLTSASATGVFHKLTTRFTVTSTGDIKIGMYQEYQEETTNTKAYVDTITFQGPLDLLTEKKTIIYDSKCLYKNFNVKFIDSLGGYSYWTFRTYGDNGVQFGEQRQIRRNIFNDFPTSFINSQAQNDFVSVDSQDTVTLRAENLTEQQAKDLFELVRSVRVYDNNDPLKPKVLLVNKNSLNITQGEKLYNLTFSATSTFQNYRQRQ